MKAKQAHQELYSERNTKTRENGNGGWLREMTEKTHNGKRNFIITTPACICWCVWVGLRDPGAYRSPDWILLFTPTQSQCDTSHPMVAPSTILILTSTNKATPWRHTTRPAAFPTDHQSLPVVCRPSLSSRKLHWRIGLVTDCASTSDCFQHRN